MQKSLIFVHNTEFSLETEERPAIVKLAYDKFRTREDIIALVEKGDAPPVIQGIPADKDQNN